MPELDGEITVSINAFEDTSFLLPITGNSVIQVPEPIFIKLSIDAAAANFNLQLKRCWATPSGNPNDETAYVFIDEYCGDSGELNSGNLDIMSNGANNEAAFRLSSFTFSDADSNDIYLHCSTRLCDSSIQQCQIPCGRRRRNARNALKFVHEHNNLYTMTSGPIHIIKP
jgi:hypothetical protein